MSFAPKIRLQSIFLLFICVAVGLATNSSLTASLNAAVATAVVIGLVQQINQLRCATPVATSRDANVWFPVAFSITWRTGIAGIMAICSVAQLLVAHGFLEIPVNTELLMLDGVWWVEVILQLCIIVVLSSSIRHFQSSERAKPFNQWRSAISWILGGGLILALLPGRTLIVYLVHVATAGIEAYQPLALRRPATFPDHYSEHFRLFWLTLGACVSLMIAGMSLVRINYRANQQRSNFVASIGFCVSLLIVTGFCGYYFEVEYIRISPDLASVNFIAEPFDWFIATLLALILVTVGAYRLTQLVSTETILIQCRGDGVEPVLHESIGGLVLLAAMAIVPLLLLAWSFFQSSSSIPWEDLMGYILRNPNSYLAASVTLSSLHFLAIRWKRRNQAIAWRLADIHPARFFCNLLAVAALTVVGIPTLSAYSFVYWLGPWFLWGS